MAGYDAEVDDRFRRYRNRMACNSGAAAADDGAVTVAAVAGYTGSDAGSADRR